MARLAKTTPVNYPANLRDTALGACELPTAGDYEGAAVVGGGDGGDGHRPGSTGSALHGYSAGAAGDYGGNGRADGIINDELSAYGATKVSGPV